MKRKIELCMTLLLLLGAIVASKKLSELVTSGEVKQKETVIIVDPGHGGEDPGKVGVNDILEKDLNLQVSQKLISLLEKKGITVLTTREDDNVPNAKMEDLQKRVKFINETNPTLTICVHQNSYTDPTIKGAQVFYYAHSDDAKAAATSVQEELRFLDPTNKREIKANDTYYMLKYTQVSTIIVECGFLTNPEEAAKLTQEDYQQQIAQAICDGVIKWLDK